MKEREKNSELTRENERLRVENLKYKEELSKVKCFTRGGPSSIVEMSLDEQQLRLENAKLKEEVQQQFLSCEHYLSLFFLVRGTKLMSFFSFYFVLITD